MKPGTVRSSANKRRHDTVFTEAIKNNENIRGKLGYIKDTSTKIERVPFSEACIFFVYTVIFFAVLSQQIRIYSSQLAYNELSKTMLNQVRIGDEFFPINPLRPTFGKIRTMEHVQDLVRTLIDPATYNVSDFLLINNAKDDNYKFLTPFTALRMTQKRINKVPGISTISKYIWDPSGKKSKDSYGTSNQFYFSESDDGFVQFFNLPLFQNLTEADAILNSTIEGGYFDEFTQELILDLGFYQSVNELACFFRLSFTISAAGIVENRAEDRCFNLNPYGTVEGIVRGVFEIIFFILTFYYFVIEFMKIVNSIRNERLRDRLAATENLQGTVTDMALDQGASSIKGIVNGILTHIQSLWSFFDVVIIILALVEAGIWIQFISDVKVKKEVDSLKIVERRYQLSSEEEITRFYLLNSLITDLRDKFETYYRSCAISGVLLLLKNAKNFSNFFSSLKQMLQFTITALNKMLPFLVLFIVMVIAFAYCNYMLFASVIESVSSFPKAFFYVSTNIMQNYREFANMKQARYIAFYLYFVGFTFIICFIMVNMFLIHIIAAYRNFVQQRAKEERTKALNKKSESRPHFISAIQLFLRQKIYMRFLKCFRKKKYEKILKQEDALKSEAERDSILETNFNYNLDIQTNIVENEKKYKKFTNDFLKEKIELKANKNLVQVVWSSIFILISIIFAVIITIRRHETSQTFGMRTVIMNSIPKLHSVTPTEVENGLATLSGIAQLKQWLLNEFPTAITKNNLATTYFEDAMINGSYIGKYYLIGLNKITMTIRRKKPDTVDHMTLNKMNNVTLPFTFAWNDAPAGPDEFVGDIVSHDGSRTYVYDYSYGGYRVLIDCDNYTQIVAELQNDGVIDASLNSLLIEIPMIHAGNRIPVYFRLIIHVDNVGNINNQVMINAIQTPFTSRHYKVRDSVVLAFELVIVFVFLVDVISVIRTVREQNDIYNHWYEIYIYYFPELYKRKRWLEKPEFIRKLEFLFSTRVVIRILLAITLSINISLAIAILPGSYSLSRDFSEIITAAESGNQSALTITSDSLLSTIRTVSDLSWYLRVFDFLTINCLIANLLFFYSINSYFNFITATLKRIVTQIFNMIIVMIFLYLCFAYFLVLTIGEFDGDFTNLLYGFRTLFGSYSGISNVQVDEIIKSTDLFLLIFFFYPFLIMTKFVILNIFVSILYRSYNQTKSGGSGTVQEKTTLTVKQFFTLTYYLICPKRSKKQREVLELTQEFTKSVNPHIVMDRFRGTLEQGRGVRDVVLWSTLCAKDIMLEYELRKKIRRKARQIISKRLHEAENEYNNKRFRKLLEVRLSEYQLRELYWSYFRISQRRLMKYYTSLNKFVQNAQSRVRVVQLENIKSETIEKLRIYIDDLEKRVANNFRDIEKIKKVFKKHKMQTVDDLDREERIRNTPEKHSPPFFPDQEERGGGSFALTEENLLGSTDRDRGFSSLSHFRTESREFRNDSRDLRSQFSRDSGPKIMIVDSLHDNDDDERESGAGIMNRVSKNWNR
mgnify:CR=1 FL=1